MNIYRYAKLGQKEKELILRDEALFLEHYVDGQNIIYIYYLNGFFVEVTFKAGKVIDNLPYKRGFRFNKRDLHNIEKRNAVYNMAA